MTTSPSLETVKCLIGGTLTAAQSGQLYQIIQAAAAFVDDNIPTADCMTAERRQMVAEYVAAHWWEIGNSGGGGQRVQAEKLLDYSVTYAVDSVPAWGSTRNGVIAQSLDCTGSLGAVSKPKPTFVVLEASLT